MPRGGKRNGAGRKKGSLTSRSREIIERVAETGLTPLQVMLEAMMHYHEAGDRAKASQIARDAAPYCHPRLSAMQISGGETPVLLEYVVQIVDVTPAAEVGGNGVAHSG